MMRRLFWLVAAVVLVDTMFFAAVAPLLPHYSDELDLSKTGAGILTAAYPAGTFVGALPSGWLAVRWGVKPTLLLGLSMLGLASISFGVVKRLGVVIELSVHREDLQVMRLETWVRDRIISRIPNTSS